MERGEARAQLLCHRGRHARPADVPTCLAGCEVAPRARFPALDISDVRLLPGRVGKGRIIFKYRQLSLSQVRTAKKKRQLNAAAEQKRF